MSSLDEMIARMAESQARHQLDKAAREARAVYERFGLQVEDAVVYTASRYGRRHVSAALSDDDTRALQETAQRIAMTHKQTILDMLK
jgi:predicted NAD/FAD-binding protein